MRHLTLRLILIAGVAGLALPVLAQEAPVAAPPSAPAVVPDEAAQPPAEAAAAPIPEVWAPVPVDDQERSAYGLFLSGRLAELRGERQDAAELLTQTEALTPEQPMVRDQAFLNALLAGDLGVAARLAPAGDGAAPVLSQVGRLAGAVETWADGDPRAALAGIAADPIAAPHARAGALMTPWLAAAAGDWDLALKPVEAADADPTSLIRRETRALLLEQRGRLAEAEAEYRAINAAPNAPAGLRLSWGQFLERAGREDEARALYEPMAQATSPNPGAVVALARMAAHRPPPALRTPIGGGAAALSLAAQQAIAEGGFEFAAVYLRMAQSLQPSDETLVLLGYSLVGARQEAEARDAWGRVSTAEPALFAASRGGIAASYQRAGDAEAALAAWRLAAAAQPSEPQIAFRLASQLLDLHREGEALALLNGPVLNLPQQPSEVHLLRGAALQGLGRLDEAEAELWAAHELRPDDPTVLNSLGYMWVDSGRRVDQGAAMIARAHEARPDDGHIQDSFGWAQYRQGLYEEAVATLEAAVAKEPANAEVNDHLGDAYWRVGRRREAAWQWNRVLTLQVDEQRRAEAERKLTEGLAEPALSVAS